MFSGDSIEVFLKQYFETHNLPFNPGYREILELAGSNIEEIFLIA